MILYHWTTEDRMDSILKNGLNPNSLGIVYLTPSPDKWNQGDVCLEVETENLKLTCFEDCKDWEVLCWGKIEPKNIKILKNK
jgi:RNA:NAD 2'-phosphotransferase (TPT1/KptA family)